MDGTVLIDSTGERKGLDHLESRDVAQELWPARSSQFQTQDATPRDPPPGNSKNVRGRKAFVWQIDHLSVEQANART